ncbi:MULTISPECIES: EndoU domain-containing protein [Bacillus]|uniref:Cytoplasmic protein n=1 Tax=Bacillus cereus TaxID=1396 RepID=A0A2C1LS87_BACCE|nr:MULTISPECIES: EndoU domain-containing protein [Bacillus]PER23012.1 cytoplasmic protein [Bacillus cereus]PFA63524.1 cytoplasmic protein [Bacillus sp. AFS015896]PGL86633.1 cytoplasmic protein [Bacillus sp. AFS054943]PGU00625.1 cytoplasmic protein [Bacillus cereus]PGX10117.1 cytoplasmic protein [Bacillus sp. AFS033286]
MSLNMYLGEVHTQTQSMNAVCTATIQGMEQAIQSIDAFAVDTVLQGQTYSSAKSFFVQTFRPLAQGIIYLCEELIRQNDAFPSQFQSQVASTDVIEQEILEQIRGIDRMRAGVEGISNVLPAMQAMMSICDMMKRKLQEKLEHLHEFNYTSSSNYDTALQLATSIATGLAEVQSGKGFSPTSGTFSTQGLNMEWATSIQAIEEDRARKADNSIKDGEMCGRLEEKSPIRKAWDDKVDDVVKMFETVKKMWNGTVIGTGKAVEDEIKSMEALSNMDIGTFINVTYAILHLDETTKNMWHTFSSTVKRDIIDGDAESITQWTTYGLTQIGIGLILDRGLGRAGLVTKGAGGASTLAKGVTLVKELKQVSEILQSFKKDVSYAFSGGNGIRSGFDTPDFRQANKITIPESSIKHSDIGDFTTNPKTGDISKMKGGGHGQSNIEFLEENNMDYEITKVYENGVRVGNVPEHKVKRKRIGSNQSWFPENWTDSDIAAAGAKVAELPEFSSAENGVTIFGEYNGVRVGVIKTNGEIGTIFPDATQQP